MRRGAHVAVQRGAGDASGYPDDAYLAVGTQVLPDADTLYEWAQLVVKVKEPVGGKSIA